MATKRISKTSVDNLQAGERDDFLWDDKIAGFGVKVTPKGRKVFIFQYRLGGRGAKVRRYTIGPHGSITAEKARDEAGRLSLMTTQGIDPQSEKAEKRRETVELAFEGYLSRFTDECLKVDWPASWEDAERTLQRFAVPVLRSKSLPEIQRRDITSILRPLRKMPATEKKVFAILRRLFRWAVNNGDIQTSPMLGMEGPEGAKARDRYLEDWELVLVWRACEELGNPFGPLIRLLALTGARREEVAGLSWSELDQDRSIWSLPAERAKNGHATDIPLSVLALAEIEKVRNDRNNRNDRWPRRGLLFTTTGKTPVSGFSKAKKRLDAKIAELNEGEGLERWTLHDLRRTLATGMQRLGVRFEVTEAILNHVGESKSGVAGIYQRHDWGPEKKAALQAWSDHIKSLLTKKDETNVVQLADLRA
ncbi:tyrosine-type recombinase/integrase [Altererythrobacter sp. GH1-8]|uniref:tyrosine-type recombinase/integrase n=1 Tax=Altererythrobacter sp. GH1-8 TaxID=3349333 RepID=UPI00374CAFDB